MSPKHKYLTIVAKYVVAVVVFVAVVVIIIIIVIIIRMNFSVRYTKNLSTTFPWMMSFLSLNVRNNLF